MVLPVNTNFADYVGIAKDQAEGNPGLHTKAATSNPKDLIGNTKVAITRFPAIGTIMGAHAMMDGADKYGPYNWREKDVVAHIYIDAAYRHLMDWFEGQEIADDSKVHHLGHAIACCAILLDAQAQGNLIDDRPIKKNADGTPVDLDWLPKLLDELSHKIKVKNAAKKQQ